MLVQQILASKGDLGVITVAPGTTVQEVAELLSSKRIGAVIVSAVFSWVNPYAPLAAVFDTLTRPLLRPFRRFIPPVGGVDLSPLALLLVLQIALFVLDGLRRSILPLMLVS